MAFATYASARCGGVCIDLGPRILRRAIQRLRARIALESDAKQRQLPLGVALEAREMLSK